MRALVTGATGKVGHSVARALLERGDEVAALVRNPGRSASLLPPGAQAIKGDVTDPASVERAAAGCELVFNAMGLPEQWFADAEIFDRVNARGAEAVVMAAAKAGARRVVHTSTIDVFHAEPGGTLDESRVADYPKGTAYERSKQRAEQLALTAAAQIGIELVIVNPAAVYGPGPASGPTSIEASLLRPVVEGRRAQVPLLPPGGLGLVYSTGLATGRDRRPAGRPRQGAGGDAGAGGQGAGDRRRSGRAPRAEASAAAEGPAPLLPLGRPSGGSQGAA